MMKISTRELRRRVATPRSCEIQRGDKIAQFEAEAWLGPKLLSDIKELTEHVRRKISFDLITKIVASRFHHSQRVIVYAKERKTQ